MEYVSVSAFVEKCHNCYRDGLNGGRDNIMRSFTGLYFLTVAEKVDFGKGALLYYTSMNKIKG